MTLIGTFTSCIDCRLVLIVWLLPQQGWRRDQEMRHQADKASAAVPSAAGSPADIAQTTSRPQSSGYTAQPSNKFVDLYYSTGWREPTILYSVQGHQWDRQNMQEVRLSSSHMPSWTLPPWGRKANVPGIVESMVVVQVASSSGSWQHARFPLNGASSPDAAALEFVITNGGKLWDKPAADGAVLRASQLETASTHYPLSSRLRAQQCAQQHVFRLLLRTAQAATT